MAFCWLMKEKKQAAENDIAAWRHFQRHFDIAAQTRCDAARGSSILSQAQKSIVKEMAQTTKELIQSGNWQWTWERKHVSKCLWQSSLCCWNKSSGYSLPCQEELMHKQRCHIYIGIPVESFHYCAVILTTSAEGTWQYRHNTCS